jgi:energy coupling factor transporter S component ThiW
MVLTAFLATLGYVLNTFVSFPKMAPFQHFINVISAVLLGPWGALACAFMTGSMRMILNGSTILAIVGAIFGAFLSGLLYRTFKKLIWAVIGEVIGTGIVSAIVSVPVMQFIGKLPAVPFYFYIPFFLPASAIGASMGFLLLTALIKTKCLNRLHLLPAWEEKKSQTVFKSETKDK